jgi:glutathione peroxidase
MLTTYTNQGFTILAFPCDQFLNQEPGSNYTEIMNGIKWVRPGTTQSPFTPHPDLHHIAKINVNGLYAHPMYQFLRGACPNPTPVFRDKGWLLYNDISQNDIFWNFEKFLVDINGVPRWRFAPAAWGDGGSLVVPYLNTLFAERNGGSRRSPTGVLSLAATTVATVLLSRFL